MTEGAVLFTDKTYVYKKGGRISGPVVYHQPAYTPRVRLAQHVPGRHR